jgi:hypothetical protein
MRAIGVLLLALIVLFVSVAPASANGPVFYPGPFWPLFAPLFLPVAVAATVTAGVVGVATGVATAVTAPLAYPYGAVAPAPPVVYAPPPAAYPPRVAYSRPAAPARPFYWYYCPSAGGYYPYVATCPGGWLTVVPR